MATVVMKMCHSVMLNEHYSSLFDIKGGIIIMHSYIVLYTNSKFFTKFISVFHLKFIYIHTVLLDSVTYIMFFFPDI